MNILSLFDGMSCGLQALKQAGIPVTNYFASEVDKYAIQVAKKNHPEIIHLGDVTKWQEWDLPKIDLLIGGSPCQGFSFAGKGLNFDDPRSALFFEFVKIKEHFKPTFFMMENVKMKKEYQDVISDYLGVDPVEINSALVSAQNRKRLYWANWEIGQPVDKGIFLKDVLEENPHSNFYKISKNGSLKSFQDKASTLTGGANSGGNHTNMDLIYQTPRGFNQGGLKAINGKTPTLSGSSWENNNHLCLKDEKIRRFTPVEFERLQTLPDNYTEGVSNTQRYKMLGNGWTVAVIEHIFKSMPL